jgi:hypothetical protein
VSTSQTTIVSDIVQRTDSGFYETSGATKAQGWPEDTNTWAHLISSTHVEQDNYFSLQLAGGLFDNENFYVRKTANNGNHPWHKLWHDGNLPVGVAPGHTPRYDDMDGSGDPVLNSTSRNFYRRLGATAGRYADHIFTNDGSQLQGGPVGVDYVLLTTQTIDKKVDTYQWSMGSQLFVDNAYTLDAQGHKVYSTDPNTGAAGGGQHCALNTQVFARANCVVFGFNSNVVDYVDQPLAGRVGYEAGMGVTGLDPNKMRVVLAVNIGSAAYDNATQQGFDGENRVHKGVTIAPTNGDKYKAQFTNALHIQGRTKVAVNMSQVDTDWASNQVVAMPMNGDVVWIQPDEYLQTPTPVARLGFSADALRLKVPTLAPGEPTPGHSACKIKATIEGVGDVWIHAYR